MLAVRQGVEVPVAAQSFELVRSAILECISRSGRERACEFRYQDLVARCLRHDALCLVDGNPAHVRAHSFHFADVNACADGKPVSYCGTTYCQSAAKRVRRTLEDSQQAVTGGLHL